jgi:3-methylfumaryl-CoA hydratase
MDAIFNASMSNLSLTSPDASKPAATVREETCGLAAVRRIAAMLDLDPDRFRAGEPLPRGWQFILLGADTRRSDLRADGFPGLGVPMPDLGLPQLMLGGRTVAFHADIPIGVSLRRTSTVKEIRHRGGEGGAMAIVTLEHEICIEGQTDPALLETQTYLLLSQRRTSSSGPPNVPGLHGKPDHQTTVVPDETLLFQYSALGFNSHRIHLDRKHARDVEGFPDLVVNGGLATLLMTEFMRRDLGHMPAALKVRHVAPLYCNRPITLTAQRRAEQWNLQALDDCQRLAVEMEVTVQ